MARLVKILSLMCVVALSGCANDGASTTRPSMATNIPAERAKPLYWLNQPASASATHHDYDTLYAACEHVTRQRRFEIDREDYRSGLLTTSPLISQQVWEVWRNDVGDAEQLTASSLATYRRTVRWIIDRQGEAYVATPKVVVERFSGDRRRVTTAVHYTSVLNAAEAQTRLASSKLAQVPTTRWYATGRDEALEGELARDVQSQLAND